MDDVATGSEEKMLERADSKMELSEEEDEEPSPREGISRAEWDAVPPGYRYSDTYWDHYHGNEGYFVTTDDHFAYKVAASYTHSQAIAEKEAMKEGKIKLVQPGAKKERVKL